MYFRFPHCFLDLLRTVDCSQLAGCGSTPLIRPPNFCVPKLPCHCPPTRVPLRNLWDLVVTCLKDLIDGTFPSCLISDWWNSHPIHDCLAPHIPPLSLTQFSPRRRFCQVFYCKFFPPFSLFLFQLNTTVWSLHIAPPLVPAVPSLGMEVQLVISYLSLSALLSRFFCKWFPVALSRKSFFSPPAIFFFPGTRSVLKQKTSGLPPPFFSALTSPSHKKKHEALSATSVFFSPEIVLLYWCPVIIC